MYALAPKRNRTPLICTWVSLVSSSKPQKHQNMLYNVSTCSPISPKQIPKEAPFRRTGAIIFQRERLCESILYPNLFHIAW